ncbi:MAG: type II toxin-antitoxin system RelE/ParE family toxin [Betaproteobacteria bacterium]|nr:type II toxin-antitoxin system RelE/ParE family toxin [Betaproteobacteria bacterium]
MARIELAPQVDNDFGRILNHLHVHDASNIESRIQDILTTIDVLSDSPWIGRPLRADLRELVIGRAARGYVALYRYIPEVATVFVLSIRAQREAGYARNPPK